MHGFYSKLVRLKAYLTFFPSFLLDSFYSKLVRLKVQVLFCEYLSDDRFYSKLVRLKALTDTITQVQALSFLFQIGSIKSEKIDDKICNCLCFYSKLVRLKVPQSVQPIPCANLFLFQIGSIKSGGALELNVSYFKFLFQIGSIKSNIVKIVIYPII